MRVWVGLVSVILWIAVAAEISAGSSPAELFNLRHTATQDSWEWHLPGQRIVAARVCQDPGRWAQKGYAFFNLQTKSAAKVTVEYGLTPKLGQTATEAGEPREEHSIRLEGLRPRGTEYYVRFRIRDSAAWESPLLSFRTLLRYPYGYTFSPNDPELRWQPGAPRIITGSISPRAAEVTEMLHGVDAQCYLKHVVETITRPQMTKLEKIKAVMTFIGNAVDHNPIYVYNGPDFGLLKQDPRTGALLSGGDREAVLVLELHYCLCETVQLVAAALFRQIGVEAGRWTVPNGHHSSGRVLIDGKWYFADEDAYKKGNFPLMPDGTLPPIDWLMHSDNVYLLDTKPGWSDWGSEGGWMLTKDGFLITGDLGGGHDQSEDGYPSAWFGGKVEYPPSIPQPLPVTRVGPQRVLLEWVGSYDRDNDFRDYIVGVGTKPGLSDVASFRTPRAYYELKVPHNGRFFWRVTATDAHASGTPYAGKIYYESSVESSFDTATLAQSPDDPPATRSLPAAERVVFSLNIADGSLGGLDVHSDTADEIGLREGSYGGTAMFNIEWGKWGRVLQLVDPTNRWGALKLARTTWHEAVTTNIASGDAWEFRCVLRTGRSYMAGPSSFPLVYVTDRKNPERAIGLTLNPQVGSVDDAVKDAVGWSSLDPFDPQNQWHIYVIRISPATDKKASGKDFINFSVDGNQCGINNTHFPKGMVPGDLWISSNPVADVTAWISKIEIVRLRK